MRNCCRGGCANRLFLSSARLAQAPLERDSFSRASANTSTHPLQRKLAEKPADRDPRPRLQRRQMNLTDHAARTTASQFDGW